MTIAAGADGDVAVASDVGELSHGALASDVFGLRARVAANRSAAIATTDAGLVAAALVALDGWASEVHLLGSAVDPARLDGGVTLIPADELEVGGSRRTALIDEPTSTETRWVVYTSGTTGEPKAIRHTLSTLARTAVRSEAARQLRWGLLYDPNRMAGLQVIIQALTSGSTVVAPPLDAPLSERLATMADGSVNAISATPTLWRLILQQPHLAIELRQITLGGEIADQLVLDALARRFPHARIVHVFASTETGAAFSVRDGREGFPASYLDDPPGGVALEVRDGILHVQSPGVSTAGADGFASTGDVVELVDDRVLFRGRASGVVNVGGANVWPEQVEALLRTHPDVEDAVVTAKANAMSGNVLIATVAPAPTAEVQGLGKRVRAFVREHAPNTHVPAMVKVVDHLDVSTTGKVVR